MAGAVLITGGAGFIGRYVVEALVARGERVCVLDDLSTGEAALLNPAAHVVVGDITDQRAVDCALSEVDRVVHLAARRAVPRSFDDPAGTHHVNHVGTEVMLKRARRAGVGRFVFASSSSVYGNATVFPTPEVAALAPMSPYAASKASGEELCRSLATTKFDPVCLRYFNVYGPGQPSEGMYATLIPRVLDALERGESPVVHGDGSQRRDFTFIRDAVRATLAALDAPNRFEGAAVNVAGGTSHSVRDVIASLNEAVGRDGSVIYEPRRPGDPQHTEADLRFAECVLGYRPSIALADGLRAVVYENSHRVALSG